MNNISINLRNDNIISIKVPVNFKRQHSRKTLILSNEGNITENSERTPDEALLKALAKAYHWQRQLDKGTYSSVEDLAKRKKINSSYVSRILRLNYLSPTIKQAILDGTQPKTLMLEDMRHAFPDLWDEQLAFFGFSKR